MYNGIGLTTPRGSGTSGYVQKNLSSINKHKKKEEYRTEEDIQRMERALNRQPNKDILDHQKKRQIEVKCLEERERLEAKGLTEEEIEDHLKTFREELKIKAEQAAMIKEFKLPIMDANGRPIRETHQLAELHNERNDRIKKAFGISKDFKEGSSLQVLNQDKVTSSVAAPTEPVQSEVPQDVPISEPTTSKKIYKLIEDSDEDEEEDRKKKSRDKKSSSSRREKATSEAKKKKRSRSKSPEPEADVPKKYRISSKRRELIRDESPSDRKRRSSRSRSSSATSSDSTSSSSSSSSSSSEEEKRRRKDRSRRHYRSRSRSRSRDRSERTRRSSREERSRRRRSRSRSPRRSSPSYRESRRITSARRRPFPYKRPDESEDASTDSDDHLDMDDLTKE